MSLKPTNDLRIKYPKTKHLTFSPGISNDDKVLESDDHIFCMSNVVITEKYDAENFTGYADGYTHARSLDSKDHPSRSAAKKIWKEKAFNLPQGWRVCGENMYAKHSIFYESLEDYLYIFSIWNERNECLSWQDTVDWCSLLDLKHVPIISWKKVCDILDHHYNEAEVMECFKFYCERLAPQEVEGFVIRNAGSFHYDNFDKNVAKYVRPSHVTSDEHWMYQQVIPNKIQKEQK